MDRAMLQPPATRPGPPNWNDLTPEEQQALLAEGWQVADDGALSPPAGLAGSMAGSGGMGGYPGGVMQQGYDYDPGGYSAALGGPPATSPPAGMMPGSMGMGTGGNAATEAAPDTLNARIEFANPMGEALPDPFDAPEVTPPLRAQPGPDLKAAASTYTGDSETSGGYQGRIGRRQSSRQSKPSGRPISSRRRR